MASAAEPPSHLVPFARSVIDLLSIWPALQLSLDQSDNYQALAAQKALLDELATELVGAFLDAQTDEGGMVQTQAVPAQEDLEDYLVNWLFGTLDVRLEDDSEISISRDLIGLWREWSKLAMSDETTVRNESELVGRIERLAEGRRARGVRVESQVVDEGKLGEEEDTGEDSDDPMEVDAAQPGRKETKNRASPIVDDDGFTLVTQHR